MTPNPALNPVRFALRALLEEAAQRRLASRQAPPTTQLAPRRLVALAAALPSTVYARGLEQFIFPLGLAAIVFGCVAGGICARSGLHPVKSLLPSLPLASLLALVVDGSSLGQGLDTRLGSLLLALFVGCVPFAGSFVAGRWGGHRLRRVSAQGLQ
jgi:hypothetical protein